MRPPVGERHVQSGERLVLYPGERAQVSDVDGKEVATVEPEPGAAAWLRRMGWRLAGQWLDRVKEWRQRRG